MFFIGIFFSCVRIFAIYGVLWDSLGTCRQRNRMAVRGYKEYLVVLAS